MVSLIRSCDACNAWNQRLYKQSCGDGESDGDGERCGVMHVMGMLTEMEMVTEMAT